MQGSIFRVQLDNTHPLAFGYGSTYYALVRDTLNYRFLGEGGWNVGVMKKNDYAAGFTGRRARQEAHRYLRAGHPGNGPGSGSLFG